MISVNARSNIIRGFAQRFPSLISKQSVEHLMRENPITLEAANQLMAIVETTDSGIADRQKKTFDESVVPAQSVIDFKLDAALEILKENNRAKYDEFLKVDEALTKMKNSVLEEYNNDVNLAIGELATTPGSKVKEIEDILTTQVVADRAGFGFSTNVDQKGVKLT